MPKLSVIMPVYNAEKYLQRSVDSVLNQTLTDLELILVNDGSKDNSLQICREYEKKDKRVIVIDKENEGAGPTRNRGIERASGKYLTFPDSDDFLEVNAYEIAVNAIEEKNADLLVFGIKINVFTKDENTLGYVKEEKIDYLYLDSQEKCRSKYIDLYGSINLLSPWNKVYSKRVIDSNNVRFPDLRRMQDCVFNINYFDKINSLVVIPDTLYCWTWHSFEIQNKKMPVGLIDCAIEYDKNINRVVGSWGKLDKKAKLIIGNQFNSSITSAEFIYLPKGKLTFFNMYRHIKSINNNRYIHEFYKNFAKIKPLRKMEKLMKYRFNLILALYLYRNKK